MKIKRKCVKYLILTLTVTWVMGLFYIVYSMYVSLVDLQTKRYSVDHFIHWNDGTETVLRRQQRRQQQKQQNNNKSGLNKDISIGNWDTFLDSIVQRAPVSAPGEFGKGVYIDKSTLTEDELRKLKEGDRKHSFNVFVSDKISVRRRLRESRTEACQAITYTTPLPDTSVIVCFHNEAWSVLLRTVYSILDRSPPHLVKEIILVDDFSTFEALKAPLEDYMVRLKKVRIVRTKRREGLIRARLLGTSVATAQVLTFLDSHCECHPGWLEPLLDRIASDDTVVVCPKINSISYQSFRVDSAQVNEIGTFNLNKLEFKWMPIPQREIERRKLPTDAIRTPTIVGGLFSISKNYFEKIGEYDADMNIWGYENLELSLRVWMCGGSMEIHPCSHVGHVFRFRSPYSWDDDAQATLRRNAVRFAEVWLDEYKLFYYRQIGHELGNYGNISERKNLRQRLHCKNFKWYLNNVNPELKIPVQTPYAGEIRNKKYGLCLDTLGRLFGRIAAVSCHGELGNQYFEYDNTTMKISHDAHCIAVKKGKLLLKKCGDHLNQQWVYTKFGQFKLKNFQKCIFVDDNGSLTLKMCSNSEAQRWTMTEVKVLTL